MRPFFLLLMIGVFGCQVLSAAEGAPADKASGAFKGVVIDQKTQEPLAGANVIVQNSRRGAVTNRNGEFLISNVAPGTYTLLIEYIGYSAHKLTGISVAANQTVDLKTILLEEEPIPLREIVVTPGSYAIMGREPSPRQTLTSEDIKIMGWAEDITRAVQRIPGISANDFEAKFNVRGGEADEVLVLLDGMQIYKPFHQKDFGGGLFSTVDIEAIQGVDLLTGGYTAEYGDRMSGVLNMRSKTPSAGQRQTSLGFSLMNMRAFSMGTFARNKGSYLFSARRGYLDILNRLMKNEFKLEPKYYDVLGKVEYKLNPRHTLSLHTFLASDNYKLDEKVLEKGKTRYNIDNLVTNYGNNYGWLTLKSFFSPQLYARTILYSGLLKQRRNYNLFDDDTNAHLRTALIHDHRDFTLFGFKQDWNYEVSQKLFLKAGMDLKKSRVNFDYSNHIGYEFITAADSMVFRSDSLQTDLTQNGSQAGFYLSGKFQLFRPLTMETGLRYDYASYSNDKLWSPRISMVYSLAKTTFLRAGWGNYYQPQNIHEMRAPFKENFYYPAERATHYVLGFEHFFPNGIHFRAEGYVKEMNNIRPAYYTFANIDEFFPEARDDLIRLSINKATAKGVEFYLKYDTGNKFSWWASYVWAKALDDVTELKYDGRLVKQTGWLPRPWDQRHTINLDVNYRPNKKWHFNFTWQFHSGWPYTDFVVKRKQRDDGSFAYYHDYGLFAGSRYPPYHRLDVRVNRHYYTSNGTVTVFLHVINLYNHENIYSYDHDVVQADANSFRYDVARETYFPIIPFVGVSWEF